MQTSPEGLTAEVKEQANDIVQGSQIADKKQKMGLEIIQKAIELMELRAHLLLVPKISVIIKAKLDDSNSVWEDKKCFNLVGSLNRKNGSVVQW